MCNVEYLWIGRYFMDFFCDGLCNLFVYIGVYFVKDDGSDILLRRKNIFYC